MLKFFVLASLCVCAYCGGGGWTITLKNKALDCSAHVKFQGNNEAFEYFNVFNSEKIAPRLSKILYSDGSYKILRCDERNNENKCYMKKFDKNTENCTDGWTDPEEFLLDNYPISFTFEDDETYPMPTECPDKTSKGCSLYCSSERANECIIVDAEGHFVQTENGENWTFYDSPSMNVFEIDKCDLTDPRPHLPSPVNLCEQYKKISPAELNCSYHMKRECPNSNSNEYYGILIEQKPLILKTIDGNSVIHYRCDVKDDNGNCYYKQFNTEDQTSCRNGYDKMIDWYMPALPDSFTYDAHDYPKPVDCPDDSQGCQKYCNDYMEESCIIVDAYGHFVIDQKGCNWTFYDAPSMEEFKVEKCDKSIIPAPPDYCSELVKFYPNFPDCKFHILAEEKEDDSGMVINIYGVRENNTTIALTASVSGMLTFTVRCDIKDSEGNCFEKMNMPFGRSCMDGFNVDDSILSNVMPQPFSYNNSNYPVDAKCPDGTSGCKKYCNVFEVCVIVNTEGYLVQQNNANYKYDNAFSINNIDFTRCDGTTLPAVNVSCLSQSSSPSSAGSDHSFSSASTVKAVFTVTFIAILLALI